MSEPALTVVVKEPSDVELLRALLGADARRVRFFTGRGKIALASLARNVLFQEGGPVLVVQSTDTTNRQMIDEQRGLTKLLLSRFATESDFEVCQFVPEIEVVYFEAPDALAALLGRTVSPTELREGLLIPKAKLASLTDKQFEPKQFSPEVVEALASGTQARAFRAAVDRLCAERAAV